MGTNLDLHHVSRRSIGNRDRVIPVCRMCHIQIEQNQAWAKEHGFMDRHSEFRSEREFHANAEVRDGGPVASDCNGDAHFIPKRTFQ